MSLDLEGIKAFAAHGVGHGIAERRRASDTIDALVAEVERLAAARDALADECAMLRHSVAEAQQQLTDGRKLTERLIAEWDTFQRVANVQDEKAHRWLEELTGAQRALVAAQAREANLRDALASTATYAHFGPETVKATARAALATPADDSALREFGLKVAVAVHENEGDGTIAGSLPELVDAVLRGER